jgi:2-phosphosulfolactate phosphatase
VFDLDRATLETCAEATGTVVAIDVLRAFTTAAFAFHAGAEAITVVSTVEEAFALRDANPDWLIMGEERGLPVAGFDFSNSPAALADCDLSGRHLIQRTSAGTQGLVRSRNAQHLLAASLCCARATVAHIRTLRPERVTVVITGAHAGYGYRGDEDRACADYLEALMRGEEPPDIDSLTRRVRQSWAGRKFTDPGQPQFLPIDLDYALAVDRFPFAMVVRRQGGRCVMTPRAMRAGQEV